MSTLKALDYIFKSEELLLLYGSLSAGWRIGPKTGCCTAPGSLDTHLCYAAWRSSYSSRASIGV